jgi:hypothetical protein
MPAGRAGRYYKKKLAARPRVPFKRPCSYPLHNRMANEPLWLWADYRAHDVEWCNTCENKQGKRWEKAKTDSWQKQPNLKMANKNFADRYKFLRFAREFSPKDSRWCTWGLHYYPLEYRRESHCKFCASKDAQLRCRNDHKRKPWIYHRLVDMKAEIRELKAEKMRMVKSIEDEKKRLEMLHEELFNEGLFVTPSVRSDNGLVERHKEEIPKTGGRGPKRRRIAESYV